MDKKEQTRERVKRYRERKALQGSVTKMVENVTQSPESVTKMVTDVTLDVTPEHPVMKYLIDKDKRRKMESIVTELTKHKQLHNVYLGAGPYSLPLDVVGEMLEVTPLGTN